MANPFLAKFDSQCNECGEDMLEDEDLVYAIDDMFICQSCAVEQNRVCEDCDNIKKEEYDCCYQCYMKKKNSK